MSKKKQIEKVEKKSNSGPKKRGGKRPGSGRKPGKLSKATIERNMVQKAMQDRIYQNTDRLIGAQITLALGTNYLFRITYEGEGKNKKKVVEQITDLYTIKKYLDGELDTSTSNDEGYFYITATTPDSRAIADLLDRGFGRPVQATATTPEDVNKILDGLSNEYKPEELGTA